MTLKQKIHAHYVGVVNDKINRLQAVLNDLKESGANETKSTVGDKHETALAMLQIEQANTREQLRDVLDKKAVLDKINPASSTTTVVNGSLVKTSKGYLYVSVALGRATIEGITVTALSPQSPLGSLLVGLKQKGVAEINGNVYVVESIE